MTKYGLIYRSEWLMMDDTTTVKVEIFDTTNLIDIDDDATVVNLVPSGNHCHVSTINNDRDKLQPIRSKQARIEVLTDTSGGIDITTFSGGPDNKFYVEITQGTDFIFKGFLVTADIQQGFQPDEQILVLTASDCLGLLKDVPLTDLDGEVPTGKHKISKFLAYCLNKTGLSLSIYVVNNLRHGSGAIGPTAGNFGVYEVGVADADGWFFYIGQRFTVSGSTSNNSTFTVVSLSSSGGTTFVGVAEATSAEYPLAVTFTDESSQGHYYNTVFHDAKTYEKEIGECEDCYTVLEKILLEDCFITQWKGDWWVMRVDEWDSNSILTTIFDSTGVYQTDEAATYYDKNIGAGEPLFFINANQIAERERPINFAKLTYRYEYPLEVPCNNDFSRGDYIADLPNVTIEDIEYAAKSYEVECWEPLWSNTSTDDPQTTGIYIKKIFNANDYERERFLVLEADANFTFVMSERIPVSVNDKFTLSVQRRLSADVGGSGFFRDNHVQVRLYGDDGTYWTHQSKDSASDERKWVACTSTFRTNQKFFPIEGNVSNDLTESLDLYDGEAAPVPVSGEIAILLYRSGLYGDTKDTYFTFNFEYLPFINGSYRKYTGQYQKVTRTATGYLAKRDKQVYISDSPKKLFKGAQFLYNGTAYVLTSKFYPANVFPSGPPDATYIHPYGELQIRSVYNQWYYPNWMVSGSVMGITTGWPDLLHKYTLTDSHAITNNKYFMLVSFDQDWKMGTMEATFVEVFDTVNGKTYSDPREFKYISE